MLRHTGWYVFNSHKRYTMQYGNQKWCAVHKHHICHKSYKLMSFQKFLRYSILIHHHPIHILSHCLSPGSRKVWKKRGVRISGVRGSNRAFFDHVVSHHEFEVSLIWMANHSMRFASDFG